MIEELMTFIAVVEHKNFTKAAEAIHLSQPSVSLHIRHLEDYFGTILIQRSVKQKTIYITEAGNLLYERSKQIIRILEDTKDDFLDYSNVIKGKLRIGASFTIGEYFLPSFLGQFNKLYPDLELEVIIENTHNICEKMNNYQVDIALIEGSVTSSNYDIHPFYEDNMVLAVPYNHYLINQNYSIEELRNQTWISRERGSGTREYLEYFLSTNNINAKNVIVFGSNFSIKEAVKNNLGITFISSMVVESSLNDKELSILKTPHEYTRAFSYILPKGIIPSKVVQVFIDLLKH
jgi:LysR family transcriptional regulator, transcriptional activator of the cysJI operon